MGRLFSTFAVFYIGWYLGKKGLITDQDVQKLSETNAAAIAKLKEAGLL
jgi:hypothetical protein